MFFNMLFLFLISDDACARSIKGIADKLSGEAARIGLSVGAVGIVVGGIALAIGRQDAGRLVTCAVLGTLIVLMKDSIVSFLQSMV